MINIRPGPFKKYFTEVIRDPLRRPNMAICIQCAHKDIDSSTCNNPDLPITNFIYGLRPCITLNPKGDCKGFKPIPEPESIYETEEDEELAKNIPEDDVEVRIEQERKALDEWEKRMKFNATE